MTILFTHSHFVVFSKKGRKKKFKLSLAGQLPVDSVPPVSLGAFTDTGHTQAKSEEGKDSKIATTRRSPHFSFGMQFFAVFCCFFCKRNT